MILTRTGNATWSGNARQANQLLNRERPEVTCVRSRLALLQCDPLIVGRMFDELLSCNCSGKHWTRLQNALYICHPAPSIILKAFDTIEMFHPKKGGNSGMYVASTENFLQPVQLQPVQAGETATARVRLKMRPVMAMSRVTAVSMLIVWLLILCASAMAQSGSFDARMPASELLRRAVDGELKGQANDHTHWMFHLTTHRSSKEEVRCVVQTKQGDLDRLLSINGHPLTPEQQKREDRRIANLLTKPDETSKQHRAQQKDARQTEDLFRMLPAALTVKYGERKDDLVELLFEPDPNFDPPTREASVFHAMEGSIWINLKEDRLAEIEGHLMREVKFAGGLLGYLAKGGEFHVKQSEVSPQHWEISLLHVNMHGKALFFKTISVRQDESRSNFRQVPDNLTLAQAAEELQKESEVKSARGGVRDSLATGMRAVTFGQTHSSAQPDRNLEVFCETRILCISAFIHGMVLRSDSGNSGCFCRRYCACFPFSAA